MGVKIDQFKEKGMAVKAALKSLHYLLKENKDNSILLLLSGGSAFSILGGISEDLLGKWVTISVLDERYSQNPQVNNFLQLMALPFYKRAKKSGCSFIPANFSKMLSLEGAADFFDHQLRNWKAKNKKGVIIITQGLGDDGHTSGIMPFPEDEEEFKKRFEGERWVTGYNAKGKNPYPLRITTTLTFLKNYIDHSIFFTAGISKREAFERLLKGEAKLHEMPSQIIWQMKDVRVFACVA